MASAFIFLAAKVEEQPKKIEHVIRTYYYLHNRGEDGRPIEVDLKSQDYLEKVQDLVINENILLQTLGFKVTIDHSNTHVVKLCQLVKGKTVEHIRWIERVQFHYCHSDRKTRHVYNCFDKATSIADKLFALSPSNLTFRYSPFSETWSYVTDIVCALHEIVPVLTLLLTNLCLQYSPQVIAATCINLACKWADWELQRSKEGKDWWHYLAPTLTSEQLEETSKLFLSVMEKADPKLKNQLVSQFKLSSDSSPNSRSASPVPLSSGRSSQHNTPHRTSSTAPHAHHLHSNYTPDRGHSSKAPATIVQDSAPAKTYAEHRERSRLAATTETSSKSRPHHVESPLARSDMKRSYPKDSHTSTHNVNSKSYDISAHQTTPAATYNNNPYAKQSRNHDSGKSRHHQHHRHHTANSMDQSPVKRPRIAGENGNSEQRPPLPPQPPLPRPPPPP